MIVDSWTNAFAAAVVDALRTERALKIWLSIPAALIKVRSQRPNVVDVTGLWGRLNEINNLSGREDGITGRTFLDNLRYCLKHSTGQSRQKMLLLVYLHYQSCYSLPVFLDTPSGRTLPCLRSRDAKAEIPSGQVRAFVVSSFKASSNVRMLTH